MVGISAPEKLRKGHSKKAAGRKRREHDHSADAKQHDGSLREARFHVRAHASSSSASTASQKAARLRRSTRTRPSFFSSVMRSPTYSAAMPTASAMPLSIASRL